MKFGKRLQDEIFGAWRDFYVDYKRLKKLARRNDLEHEEFREAFLQAVGEELEKSGWLVKELLGELQEAHAELLNRPMDSSNEEPRNVKNIFRRIVGAVKSKKNDRQDEEESITPGVDDRGDQQENASQTTSADSRNLLGNFLRVRTLGEAGGVAPTTTVEIGSAKQDAHSPLSREEVSAEEAATGSPVKQFVMGLLGDSQPKKVDSSTLQGQFFALYINAHKLQHFAELNMEAIRKANKKIKKNRTDSGNLCAAVETELDSSQLHTLLPQLYALISDSMAEYEKRFHATLDPYKEISLTERWHAKWPYLFLAVALFCLTMYIPVFDSHPAAHNCLALFVLVIVLWVTEAIPFFCTAMLIPIFAVPLRIVLSPSTHEPASAVEASHILLAKVMDHVQILVLGGLTIGKALAKTHLEVFVADGVHRLAAHRPALYLLGVMLSSCVLCAFVSNVAAPLLALGVIHRTLWEFPEGTDAPKGILLGLAFACNVGGMLSPIASPQNAVAMSTISTFYNLSFAQWVGVAILPVVVTVVFAWVLILVVWKPFKKVTYIPLQMPNVHANPEANLVNRIVVLVTFAVTIVLWVMPSSLFFGDTGIVALIPIVVFFGVGILSKEDFNTLSWHLMFLLAGGNMLGLCAKDSSMLEVIAHSMQPMLQKQAPYLTLVLIVVIVAVITTFVSHTVSAMILLPIIANIAFLLPPTTGVFQVTPISVVMTSALMCSGAMAFPISSFPNVNSLLAEDAKGSPYLKAKDFFFTGAILTIFFAICLISWMVPLTSHILT